MLSRFIMAFLPRSKHLLISWLQSPSTVILEPKKIICHCFHFFPIYLPWSDETGYHDLRFWGFFVVVFFFFFKFYYYYYFTLQYCIGFVIHHWDDPEGWYGQGGGRGVQDWEHVYTVADSCWCMAKRWVLNQFFSLSSFTVIKRLFSSSSRSAIRGDVISIFKVIDFTHDSVYMSTLFSQFIPPSLPPTVSKSLFSTYASLLLPCK